MQLGVSERPYMVVEACSAPRPTQSLRGTLEQYQVQCARLRVSRDCDLLILMLLQIVQRDIVAAAAALLPRVHVVINKEPRKGAMEASITPASFGLLPVTHPLSPAPLSRSTSSYPHQPASNASLSTAKFARERSLHAPNPKPQTSNLKP